MVIKKEKMLYVINYKVYGTQKQTALLIVTMEPYTFTFVIPEVVGL